MYYSDGFRDTEAEGVMLEIFNLLNGVVNPNNPIKGLRFYEELEEVPLGFVVLQGPPGFGDHEDSENANYILAGSSNIRSFIANHGRDNSYVYFIDFIVHELYHSTQNIDLPRYVSDQEYYDMIETDCEYHSSLFMYNYMGWILSHLSVPLEVNFNLSETFHNLRKDRNAEEYANMLNDPWVINM